MTPIRPRVVALQVAVVFAPKGHGPFKHLRNATDRTALGYFHILGFILRANRHPAFEDAPV